ncbi:MAG: lipopolysaccharide heptosyltransferase II [Deltaproteobacteria bacterium]|jgi:heptosyltransferase-2|nr:lipopolysaccharide heptosyltransferase II [Deltaproteobacteria bacterium]
MTERFGKSQGPIVVRGLNWLGDAVMSFPALAAIMDDDPERDLFVLTRAGAAGAYAALVGEENTLIEDRSFASRFRAARKIKKMAPAKMVIFPNSFSTAFYAAFSRAPFRAGSAANGRSIFLTRPVVFTEEEKAAHESFRFLRVVEEMGLKACFSRPALTLPDLTERHVLPEGLRLAVAPGAAFGGAKRWPEEEFAAAATLILADRLGGVVILGGPSEISSAAKLESLLSPSVPTLNLAGQTSLKEAIAVLGRCHLTLANDSGLMHLSAALNVPVAAVFGPTNPVRTAPLGRRCAILRKPCGCSPCRHRECPKPQRLCFKDLSPEMVKREADRLLSPVREATKNLFLLPPPGLNILEGWPEKRGQDVKCFAFSRHFSEMGVKPEEIPAFLTMLREPLEEVRHWRVFLKKNGLAPATCHFMGQNPEIVRLAHNLGGQAILVMKEEARAGMPDLLAAGALPALAAPSYARGFEWLFSS